MAGTCPLCGKFAGAAFLPLHAASCNGRSSAPPTPPPQFAARAPPRRTSPPPGAPPTERGAPGFHVFEDVLSSGDEDALVQAITHTRAEWADLRARRVTSFGPQWSRARRRHPHESDGAKVTPLPSFVAALVMPVVRRAVPAPLYSGSPNQLCVSVYRGVDSFILPHNDNENDTLRDPILGLSLGSGTSMTLILPKALSPTGAIVKADVALPRRSLYVMSGDALHVWHHGIFEGKTSGTRYSVTLRRVLPPPGEDGEARRKREASRPPREGKRLRQSRLHFK